MKFLILFPSPGRGGAEEYALTIAKAAALRGWETHVAFQTTAQTASLVRDLQANKIQYHALAIQETSDSRAQILLKQVLRLFRTLFLLWKLKPNAVQIVLPWQNLGRASLFACGMLKLPTLVVFQLAPYKLNFSTKARQLYAWARVRNQQWIAVSEQNRQVLSESFNIPKHEIVCIYNGADLKVDSQDQRDEAANPIRQHIDSELGISSDAKIVLTVGRLCWQKGYHLLLQTIPHLVQAFPDLHFIWVGDGESRDDLTQQLKEYGIEDKVSILGYRSDVADLLKIADLFVFPSLYEGQPFALLEAMAQELPIIASNTSGIPELIESHKHGILFRQGDSCDLLASITWAMHNMEKMQTMAKAASLRVKEFSEQRMINETLQQVVELSQQKNYSKTQKQLAENL
jgi:glycosyltransferase involved in cell wall biosynthesis